MLSLEEQTQPCTESSTEAMDTNKGQRTTAKLLEEAQHLSGALMEPTYATIDEPMTAMIGGSEAVISDILSTQDPRELTLSQAGKRTPAPSEMRAGLPAGSFRPTWSETQRCRQILAQSSFFKSCLLYTSDAADE